MKIKLLFAAAALLMVSVVSLPAHAGQTAPATGTKAAQSSAAAAKATPAAMPSDATIADARAKGMVWVNLNTKVYHKDDAMYGKTKHGQFMTEADAQKAGARLAKASPVGKKAPAAQVAKKQ